MSYLTIGVLLWRNHLYWYKMRDIVLIVHDIRSTHNVGSLLRTADGIGVTHVYFTGYTPYPTLTENDPRLPHIHKKMTEQIHKTALGAELSVSWSQNDDVFRVLTKLRNDGYELIALEQHKNAITLPAFSPPSKVALLLGREVEGVATELLNAVDGIVEIPMNGQKESFNVVQAAAIALYHFRYMG